MAERCSLKVCIIFVFLPFSVESSNNNEHLSSNAEPLKDGNSGSKDWKNFEVGDRIDVLDVIILNFIIFDFRIMNGRLELFKECIKTS